MRSAQLLLCLLFIFLILAPSPAGAMNCYQGLQNISAPLNISAVQCPMPNALTCTKTVDFRSGLITRACQMANCTINSGSSYDYSPQAICVNNSNTQTSFCCCYGDSCNWAPAPPSQMAGLFMALTLLAILSRLPNWP